MNDMSDGPANLALVVHSAGDLRLERRGEPVPQADEAVVRIIFGGICGSDLHYWQHGAAGLSVLKDPMILGHEVVGEVVAEAADGSGPEAGTPVAVHPATPGPGDGSPYPGERPNLSPGCTYMGSAAQHPHTDGAFVRRTAIPTRMLRVLPRHLSLRTATLIEPASVAQHAVKRAGGARSIAGKTTLVVGGGPIGLLIVAALKAAGAREITVADLQASALERATSLGATSTINVRTSRSQLDQVQAEVTFESSGAAAGLASALRATRRGGRLALVGLLPAGDQPVPLALAITRELELYGCFRFNEEIDQVIDDLSSGALKIDPVITHVFAAADYEEAFRVAADTAGSGKVLLSF